MAVLVSRDGEILLGPEEFGHDKEGLERLYESVKVLVADFAVFMEATSIYHEQPEKFFKGKGKTVIVTNPLLISLTKATLRRTKTDKTDCVMLAMAYFNGNYSLSPIDDYEVSLQPQARMVESIAADLAKLKTMYLQSISRCFPSIEKQISIQSIYSPSILNLLIKWPHPDCLKGKSEEQIFKAIHKDRQGNGGFRRLSRKLYSMDLYSVQPSVAKDSPACDVLVSYARRVKALTEMKESEEKKLIANAEKSRMYKVYNSFEGIGQILSAYFVAELGDITRFENEKKLTAFCGLDPSIRQSGKSINFHGHISKRGNKHARTHLFQAVMMILRNDGLKKSESDITMYYKKKRNDGKHHYAAVIACST